MKKQTILFIITLMLVIILAACSSAQTSTEQAPAEPTPEMVSADAPAAEFSTVEQAIEKIKEVRSAGRDKMAHPGNYKLYEKDHIYFLKKSPLLGYEQASILLTLQGTDIAYINDANLAVFSWYQGYENPEKIKELTDRYSLHRYEDTKFFFGKSKSDIFIYWWENGDQFCLRYPADSNIAPEDAIEYLEVEKIDL